MLLKSEGFASSLFDPGATLTLQDFCKQNALPYADMGHPIPLDVFVSYGRAFQERLVPHLEQRNIVAIHHNPGTSAFHLDVDDGTSFAARNVVIAVGLSYFRNVPAELKKIPPEHRSHSADYGDLSGLKNKDVIVLGGGASAIDLAALVHEQGAKVRLIARRAIVLMTKMQLPRPLHERVRNPMSGIGPGWRSRFYTDAPLAFYLLPRETRLRIVKNHLGPGGGWFMHDRVVGRVQIIEGHRLRQASHRDSDVELRFQTASGGEKRLTTEHVIAATGYRVDLRALTFLDDDLRGRLQHVEWTPVLSSQFESSIPGLYFVGPAAANCFGPLMRFAVGAGFVSRRISRRLARSAR